MSERSSRILIMDDQPVSGGNTAARKATEGPLASIAIAAVPVRGGGKILALVTVIFGVNDLRPLGIGEAMEHLPRLVKCRPGTP
jgi:hypothetical protein